MPYLLWMQGRAGLLHPASALWFMMQVDKKERSSRNNHPAIYLPPHSVWKAGNLAICSANKPMEWLP